ncbi:prolyl oligopeptidase family serine peptidase [Actinoplanes sp. N902-109]|uniref:prolyl oligopeptidase family serine peptidase n=1 Tax=Actinoplanes sp. (strain N902-109) TaxID=649831 RepID=UPI000329689D|nr:prolyl oligopeptidase family serine peptidase [Actinoplanes sp. N902-109]AGL17112.1 peptidase S9 prolyl oligopeptidase active site domain protein [Actinoplanes sp. N902-109]
MSAFDDLDAYVALSRLDGLHLAPDGRRLVVGVGTPDRTNSRYATAVWEVDPDGSRPARRLTRSDKGESPAGFTPAGDLLFVSARERPDATLPAEPGAPGAGAPATGKPAGGGGKDEPQAALWLQPAGGGDARVLACPPGGVRGVRVSGSGTVVLGSALLPSAADVADDKEARSGRKDAGVSAILHEGFPVRYWDHDLGPDRTRLLVGELRAGTSRELRAGTSRELGAGVGRELGAGTGRELPPGAGRELGEEAVLELRDLTGHAGGALTDTCSWDITPDGRTVVTMWAVAEPHGSQRYVVMAFDVASGERRELAGDAEHDYEDPRVSPDGGQVAVVVRRRSTVDDPGRTWIGIVPLAGGGVRALTAGWDRLPSGARWTPDGASLVVSADDQGRSPLWRVETGTGQVHRLTADHGAYTSIQIAPDGRSVYALRSAIDSPPAPVRVDLPGGGEPVVLYDADSVRVPGRLEEVTATAADGTPLRAWIALPEGGEPAPLLLWVHGGPQASWNAWQWRWNPWLAVARGYAVLLPDPALSTGYGTDFLRRGWGDWGGTPYTDLMTLTDAAESRHDIDASRTGAMGGSFGGYMANWIAGHTDRFAAIVTHASLWALEPFVGTTDASFYWSREMTPEMTAANSPHRFASAITTPMLVIHGDKDYRVPIGEALRLWWALMSAGDGEPGPHKFLYFPDENHWILKPGNVKAWYATVFAFLDHHVLGEKWERPALLS